MMTNKARIIVYVALLAATMTVATSIAARAEARPSGIVTCNERGCSDWHRAAPVKKSVKVARQHKRTAKPAFDANGNRAYLVTVTTKSGSHSKVHARFQAPMQAILNDIESKGYTIKYIGCYRSDWGVAGAHPQGRACDACQWARNRTDGRKGCNLPSDTELNQIARNHGCVHGAEWGLPDRGHFECGRSSRVAHHQRAPWPRVVQQTRTSTQ